MKKREQINKLEKEIKALEEKIAELEQINIYNFNVIYEMIGRISDLVSQRSKDVDVSLKNICMVLNNNSKAVSEAQGILVPLMRDYQQREELFLMSLMEEAGKFQKYPM